MRERLNFANKEEYRQKVGKRYLVACMIFYILSVSVKGIFNSETRYLIEIWHLTQTQVQLANTLYFITYACVQIFLCIFMSKINIQKYTFVTIPISAIFSALMGLATNIKTMWVLFALVGIFQAAMFCATNYLLTKYLPRKLLTPANKWIASGYAIGTAFAYIITGIFVGLSAWQIPYFLINGLLIISVAWLVYETKIISKFSKINKKLDIRQLIVERKESVSNDNLPLTVVEKPIFALSNKKRRVLFYVIILTLSLLINGIYCGAVNFVTSVLVDIHAFPQDASIYVTTIVIVLIVLGPMLSINSCEKHKDFIKQGIKYLLIFMPITILTALFYDLNIIVYVVLILTLLILINGIRSILNNVIAFKMKDQINVAAFTSLTNAFASIAASVWPLIIALIKDNSNWAMTYWTLAIMTAVVLLATIILDRVVKTIYKKDNNGEILE